MTFVERAECSTIKWIKYRERMRDEKLVKRVQNKFEL